MNGPAIAEATRLAAVRIPAVTDALSLVRLFAASIGRHIDLPPEIVDDLKLALTEVCSAAIEVSRAERDVVTVTVSWPPDPVSLVVRVAASSSFSMGVTASEDCTRLLNALRLELRPIDGGRGVEFAVPMTSFL